MIQQIPPTPTLIPLGTPINLQMPEVTLWEMTSPGIGLWGQLGAYTPGIQWAVIIVLGIVLIAIIAISLRRLGEDEA